MLLYIENSWSYIVSVYLFQIPFAQLSIATYSTTCRVFVQCFCICLKYERFMTAMRCPRVINKLWRRLQNGSALASKSHKYLNWLVLFALINFIQFSRVLCCALVWNYLLWMHSLTTKILMIFLDFCDTHVEPNFWSDDDSSDKKKKITLKCEYVLKGSHDFCLLRAAPVNGISVSAMEKRGKRGGGAVRE